MKRKVISFIISLLVLAVIGVGGMIVYKRLSPSKVKRSMASQYNTLGEDQALIVLNGVPLEENFGKVIGGQDYVEISFARQYLNKRLYWDDKARILSLATSDGLIQMKANANSYTLGNETKEPKTQVIYVDGSTVYISMDFVSQYSYINYESKGEEVPHRILVQSDFTTDCVFGVLAKDEYLRVGPNKKYDYLLKIPRNNKVVVEESARVENGYQKVYTMDGIAGYVPLESIGGREQEPWTAKGKEDIFQPMSMEKKVCLGWQYTDTSGEYDLQSKILNAGAMNVISPTWMKVVDDQGTVENNGTQNYVTMAHSAGLKVWGMVQYEKDSKISKVLKRTKRRTRLVQNILQAAMSCGMDGVNIDFEELRESSMEGYLEFLRELVLVCHANNILVSADNYNATDATFYYDWAEQGKILDYVIFMAYDEHYPGGGSIGSVSSLSYVEEGTKTALQYVPKERTVIALPFYTRLWKTTKNKKGENKITSTAYGMSGAESILHEKNITPKWDDNSGQYYASYNEGKDQYNIWLEEETSLELKMKSVMAQEVYGVAFWQLGLERPATWKMIAEQIK